VAGTDCRDQPRTFWSWHQAVAADPKSAVNGGNNRKYAQPWRVEDSLELYHVNAWGKGYFSINGAGHVVVRPDTLPNREIDLFEVVEGLKARDLTAPVVVRFSDILAHRLKQMHAAFAHDHSRGRELRRARSDPQAC
jgi:arginine decarboxylase-like protein